MADDDDGLSFIPKLLRPFNSKASQTVGATAKSATQLKSLSLAKSFSSMLFKDLDDDNKTTGNKENTNSAALPKQGSSSMRGAMTTLPK